MVRNVFLYVFFFLVPLFSQAENGYSIEVQLDGFERDTIMLGYYLMDKQYLQDTAYRNAKGTFVFEGEETLKPGVYLVIMPPENAFFQILVNEREQNFFIRTSVNNNVGDFEQSGSSENQLFYDYLGFLNAQRPEAEKLQQEIVERRKEEKDTEKLEKELESLNQQVSIYQKNLVLNHPESLTAAIIQSTFEIDIPAFDETDEQELQKKRYFFYKNHYFDYLNLGDPRLLRSPVLFGKVKDFIEKVTVQHPDSISRSIDTVLSRMMEAEETFKFYLVHFLNKYAQSKVVGMDAIYVHLVDHYYAKGMAPWTEEEQLQKIIDNAITLKPLLIGKVAPDISMQVIDVDGTIEAKDAENEYQRFKTAGTIDLHQVESPFTVLVFWAPDCGHCKKSMPKLLEFYQQYKDKGVVIYSVCTKTYKDMPDCAQFIKDKNLEGSNFFNMVDPFFKSRFKTIYDIKTTPQLYILDENKEIITKKIAVDQLAEVMDSLLKFKAEKDSIKE